MKLDTVIGNVTVITLEEGAPVLENAYIGIREGKIDWIGQSPPSQGQAQFIDGRGRLAMPGLVNAHTHVGMSVLRGYADDYVLQEWLENHIWPAEGKMDGRCVRAAAMLSFAEMLATGTVAVSDMYFHTDDVAQAAETAGIYANISNGALCFQPETYSFEDNNSTREMSHMLERWHGADGGRIRLDAAIHAEYTSFRRLWQDYADYAHRHDLVLHVHLSETASEHQGCIERQGKTPAQALAEAGVWDGPALAAHCVHVSPEDIELLAQKGVSACHNPVSNLKLASGVAPVPEMLTKRVNVALGTDSVASNNNHDLFEELKLAAILHKGVGGDPLAVPALEAIRMATENGARAQGRAGQLGRIAVGYDASLILIDLSRPGLMPVHSPVSQAAYAARGGDVSLTMVRGRVLYENGEHKTLDMERIGHELKNYVMPRIFGA